MRPPDVPDEREPAAARDLPPRPAGQLRELRLRLERLPQGHPSAPGQPPRPGSDVREPGGDVREPGSDWREPGGDAREPGAGPGEDHEPEEDVAEPGPGAPPETDLAGGDEGDDDPDEAGRAAHGREPGRAARGDPGPAAGHGPIGLGPLGAGEPYRPWFTDGDPGEPWFARGAD